MESVTLKVGPGLFQDPILGPLRKSLFVTPTDTVYGISAVTSLSGANKTIASLKGRANSQFIVLISRPEDVERVASLTPEQKTHISHYWPAPITFILRDHHGKTIAVRCPKNSFLNGLISALGEPIYSTSANLHGQPEAQTVDEAKRQLGDKVAFYIDGGPSLQTKLSTLVDLTVSPPRVLRPGAVPFT